MSSPKGEAVQTDTATPRLWRCPQCRLVFEADREPAICVVCGTAAPCLPAEGPPPSDVPVEIADREPTSPMDARGRRQGGSSG